MRSIGNLLLFGLLFLISCSSGTTNSPSPSPPPDFSLAISLQLFRFLQDKAKLFPSLLPLRMGLAALW